jgi:hypothetical protein
MEELSMSKFSIDKENEVIGYVKRSVVDIARKCSVYSTDVIETIKKLYGNEN